MDKIALIRLSSLGDVILAEPVAANLKINYSDSEITFFTRRQYLPVVEMFSSVDHAVGFDYENRHSDKHSIKEELGYQTKGYDLALDIHKVNRSRFILKNLKAQKKLTYSKNGIYRWWSVVTKNKKVETHTLDRYLRPLQQLGLKIHTRNPSLSVPEKAVTDARGILTDNNLAEDEFVVLAVGASFPTKHYPLPQFVELARLIIEKYGLKVMVVEKIRYDYLNLFDDLSQTGSLMLGIDYDIPVLAGILSKARLTVSNDSGVMHLASACGSPTLGLFGPTHPVLGFAPVGDNSLALTVDEKCSPCSLHGQKLCYRDQQYCFTRLTPGIVLEKAENLLGRA